ncbi:MAG: 50S ribosomal protein L30e [Candidatus Altiarchaeota archaeon]
MKVDVKQQLNNVIETGKVVLGSKETMSAILHGKPKLILLSGNCPQRERESLKYYCKLSKTPCVTLKESSIEIGSSLGRPYPISSIAVLDQGESTILEAIE